MEPIVLIGFMGAGKTTIANELGGVLNLPVYDTDDLIVKKINMSIADFFEKHGEEKFRKVEMKVLKDVVKKDGIVSVGGGIVENEINRKILSELKNVVFLEAPIDILLERIRQDKRVLRPLASDKTQDEIAQLYQKRLVFYRDCSSMVIGTKDKTPLEITSIIQEELK